MADDNLELNLDQGAAKKKKLIIIAAVVVVLLAVGGFFLLSGGDKAPDAAAESAAGDATAEGAAVVAAPEIFYIAVQRPFIFNVVSKPRNRVVQIKVALMVRSSEDELLARQHMPLIESTLLANFSQMTEEELTTIEGKARLRTIALSTVRDALNAVEKRDVVAEVLLTAFVMQ